MRFLTRELTLTLQGDLDQAHLDRLCENLGLTRSGTAESPIGSELGRREQHRPRHRAFIGMIYTLSRTGADEWTLTLDALPLPDSRKWRNLAEIGCRAAGLAVKQHPTDTDAVAPPDADVPLLAADDEATATHDPTPAVQPPIPYDGSIYAVQSDWPPDETETATLDPPPPTAGPSSTCRASQRRFWSCSMTSPCRKY